MGDTQTQAKCDIYIPGNAIQLLEEIKLLWDAYENMDESCRHYVDWTKPIQKDKYCMVSLIWRKYDE